MLLSEGPTDDVNEITGTAEKINSISFTKTKKFSIWLHYSGHDTCLYVNTTKIRKFKVRGEMPRQEISLKKCVKSFYKR